MKKKCCDCKFLKDEFGDCCAILLKAYAMFRSMIPHPSGTLPEDRRKQYAQEFSCSEFKEAKDAKDN